MDNLFMLNGLNLSPIPLDFSNSMTTVEWLCEIQAKVNEVVAFVSGWETNANGYTDTQILSVRSYIDGINVVLLGKILEIKTDAIAHSDNNKANALAEMQRNLNTTRDFILTQMEDGDSVIALDLQAKYDYLLSLIRQYSMQIVDPTTGQYSTVQQVLYNLYDMLRNDAITCAEYDALMLTAIIFDGMNVTAKMFDMNGKSILI